MSEHTLEVNTKSLELTWMGKTFLRFLDQNVIREISMMPKGSVLISVNGLTCKSPGSVWELIARRRFPKAQSLQTNDSVHPNSPACKVLPDQFFGATVTEKYPFLSSPSSVLTSLGVLQKMLQEKIIAPSRALIKNAYYYPSLYHDAFNMIFTGRKDNEEYERCVPMLRGYGGSAYRNCAASITGTMCFAHVYSVLFCDFSHWQVMENPFLLLTS